jgi:hypothetical protein
MTSHGVENDEIAYYYSRDARIHGPLITGPWFRRANNIEFR